MIRTGSRAAVSVTVSQSVQRRTRLSRTPTRNAPEQEEHPNTRHYALPDDRAGLMRTRLVDGVQPRRPKRTCSNDAAREAVDGARGRLAWTSWAGAGGCSLR